jgi:recombination protein RecR
VTILEKLINNFSRLPGIGKKSASRIVYYLLKVDKSFVIEFGREIRELRDIIINCPICGNFTDITPCQICSDPNRDKTIICIVEEPKDILAIESIHQYSGTYHVLMGVISPIEGIGPHELKIEQLISRIQNENVKEVILATNPTIEGETTSQFIMKKIKSPNIKITRLALGLPIGGALEYADSITLARAFTGRNEIE